MNTTTPSLRCGACGDAITAADAPADEVVYTSAEQLASRRTGTVLLTDVRPTSILVGTCDACRERAARADRLAAANPGLASALRETPEAAASRIGGALLAFEAAGLDTATTDAVFSNPRGLGLATSERLNVPAVGYGLRYDALLGPVLRLRASIPPRGRWGHLDDNERARLTAVVGRVLRERTEVQGSVPPPTTDPYGRRIERACGLCGVGTIEGYPSRQDDLWPGLYRTHGDTLGRRGPTPLAFAACAACDAQLRRHGIGATAAARALLAHMGVEKLFLVGDEPEFLRPIAWLAASNREPNERPWQHLGDLSELRERLSARPAPLRTTAPDERPLNDDRILVALGAV